MPLLTNLNLRIPEKHILYRLGYKEGRTDASADILKLVRRVSVEANAVLEPRAVYEIFDVGANDGASVILTGGPVIRSAAIAKLLEGCPKAVLLAVTVGSAITELVKSTGDLTLAAILDAAASELADEAADRVCENLAREAGAMRLGTTRRFSPGYSDWKLDVQPVLLRAVGADRIGLISSGDFVLNPEKSVTAIVGLTMPAGNSACPAC